MFVKNFDDIVMANSPRNVPPGWPSRGRRDLKLQGQDKNLRELAHVPKLECFRRFSSRGAIAPSIGIDLD